VHKSGHKTPIIIINHHHHRLATLNNYITSMFAAQSSDDCAIFAFQVKASKIGFPVNLLKPQKPTCV